jgi:hypothetical protein
MTGETMSSEQRTARETLIDLVLTQEILGPAVRQAIVASLRAAPAPEPEHVCGGCGYKWNWPVPSPIELCGDCWRKTWPVLRGAAPAPEGETPMPRCVVCRTEYPTTGQQAGPVAGVWGKNFMVCRLCVDAARDAKRKRNAPASPAPTPEGRETERKAIEAEIGEPVVFIDEAADGSASRR